MNFVPPNDPILSRIAEKVPSAEIETHEFQQLIDAMIAFAGGEQGDPKRTILVGLAAPQVGIGQRIILVDNGADGKGGFGDLRVYINPEIISASLERESWYEGCYSTGNTAAIIERSQHIVIEALDRQGAIIRENHQGYVARIFQHEIDHLHGIRCPMRIKRLEDLHTVLPEQFPEYRNQQGWRNWPIKCSWENWLKKLERD